MTLTWIILTAVLDCSGNPEAGVVRFAADYGLTPQVEAGHVEEPALASEVSLFVPLEPGPGEVVYAAYYAIDEAGNRSTTCTLEGTR
jgi:hypothetical protein